MDAKRDRFNLSLQINHLKSLKKYKDKYRTDSIRLKGYDYSSEGSYFLTICTKNRISYFGKVERRRMVLNSSGKLVADEWKRTTKKRARVILGEWVVMPNHFHALIYLKPIEDCRDALHASQKEENLELKQEGDGRGPSLQNYKNKFGPQRNNIPSIIRGFKSSCTRQIRKSGIKSFSWQKGYYDHIVRSQKSLIKIEEYIRENPKLWIDDCYYQ